VPATRTVWCLVDRKRSCKWRFELVSEDAVKCTFNRYDGKYKNESFVKSREEARVIWKQLKAQGFKDVFR
jgi:hypothetical protein